MKKKLIIILISILIIMNIMSKEKKEENLAYYIETNDGYEYRENIPISGYSFDHAKCNGSKVKEKNIEYNEETKNFTLKNQSETTGCDLYFKKNGDEIKEEYSIKYNLNGGSVEGNPTSYDVTSEAITLKNPSKTGYTFTGWTGSNGSTAQTTVTIPKGSTGNKTYTANYKANTYTVEYNSNGGSGQQLHQLIHTIQLKL